MAYKPPKQSIVDNDLKNTPSNEAVFEALKLKVDEPTVLGSNGQLLQLDGYVSGEAVTSWVNPPSASSLPSYSIDTVLYSTASAAEWRIVGTGSSDAAYPTNSLIFGKAKPAGFTSQTSILIGTGTAGNASTGANNIIIGHNAVPVIGSGANSVVIGQGTTTISGDNVIIGNAANASLNLNVSIGVSASCGNFGGVAIGNSAGCQISSVAIGRLAAAGIVGVPGTAIGAGANAGNNCVSIGYEAKGGTGADNIVIGNNAGRSASTGSDNTIVGRSAGDALTSGNNLVLIGKNAGGAITTGVTSVIIGNSSGLVHTSPDRLVLIGDNAGAAMTSGARSIAVGNLALGASTGASFCVAIGSQALVSCTGNNNLAAGQAAGISLTSGTDNVLLGNNVGRALATGAADLSTAGSNVIIGSQASGSANNITNGIALGRNSVTNSSAFAVGGISAAIDTVFLGTGAATTTVAQAVKIQTQSASGTDTDLSASTLTLAGSRSTGNKDGGAVIISTAPAGASGTTLNAHVERMCVTASGNVGIGTTTPSQKLEVAGAVLATEYRVPNYRLDPHKHEHTQNSAGSHNINWDTGAAQVLTLNGSITSLTFSNPVEGASYVIKIVQGASGGPYTISWPASVKFGVGAPPILSTSANAIDLISFVYLNGEYYGSYSLGFA